MREQPTSRYAIMDNLNRRKIEERQSLANLEKTLRIAEIKNDKEVNDLKDEIELSKSNYKREHASWKKYKLVAKELLDKEYERKSRAIEEEIKEKDGTYEDEHKDYLEDATNELTKMIKDWENSKKEMEQEIQTRKEVLTEIESGITSLKEMSAEQK